MGPRQNDELENGRCEPRQQLWSMQQRNDGAQLQDAMRPEDAVSIRCASVLLLRVSSAWSAPAGVCQVVDVGEMPRIIMREVTYHPRGPESRQSRDQSTLGELSSASPKSRKSKFVGSPFSRRSHAPLVERSRLVTFSSRDITF